MSLLEQLRLASLECAEQDTEPWRPKLEDRLRGIEAMSTAALLDILHARATTGTARRLAAVMRSLHFIPIKSRRLLPGGRAGNTVTRGWVRPIREMKSSPMTSTAGGAGPNRQGIP